MTEVWKGEVWGTNQGEQEGEDPGQEGAIIVKIYIKQT
jgi:hypothetical protein